ncbi:MAG: hypothetical protein M3296_01800 [Actinomycetota bacterium]|nr:hypothetical protein [Actinomycetota bacterium]
MSDYLPKVLGPNYASAPDDVIEEVAEGALLMQQWLAQDLLSLAEIAATKRKDPRVLRARDILERLT